MDTLRDHFPVDPVFVSELLYMVENFELDGDISSSCVKPGTVWTGSCRPVEERERAATSMVSVSRFTLEWSSLLRGSWTAPAARATCGGALSVWDQEAARKALWSLVRACERAS